MGRKSRQKGKRVELQIAKMLGTGRNPADGHSHTDIHAGRYAVEVKARKALPQWMWSAMQQAVDDLKDGREVPVVVMVQSDIGQVPQRYALLKFEDFLALKGADDERRKD